MPAAIRHAELGVAFEELKLEGEDESFEVEVPDFHFDWGVVTEDKATEKKTNSVISSVRGVREWSPAVDSLNTPPPGPARTSSPAHSSASSGHLLGLTDASTVSGSSLVPTPPYVSLGRGHLPRVSGGSDGSEQSERIRRFQRVVSAPVARSSNGMKGNESREMDESIATTSTSTYRHTVTLRPALSHSTSSSAVTSVQTTSHTYRTPGVSERTLASSTAASTSRRVGGLSRFGGPARRVIQAVDEQETIEDEVQTPPLINSPPMQPRQSPPRDSHRRSRTRSPEPLYPLETRHSRPKPVSPSPPVHREPSPPSSYSKISPTAGQPHRQYDRYGEQENRPVRPTAYAHAASTSAIQRPPPLPLQPALTYSRSTDQMLEEAVKRASPVARNTEALIPSRAAPRPAEVPASATLPSAPAAVARQDKRSFVVNGVPYERIATIGKGGSSKVYSVLCHTTRAMYALKRVALDRADAEAYQSYTNEIELLKRLRGHDRIIRLIDHQISFGPGNRPKILMMVMECGEIDFAALLDDQRGKPLNMNFVGLYWQQMLEAVHAVHLENVVHTDLKPANFVLVQGRLKIIDFGIAKAIANDTVNIQRDQQIGTVNYMSPEAIQRMNNQKVLKLSYPSDVWSLGCILYQMIYGSPPFQHIGGGPLPKMNAIANASHIIDYPTHAVPKSTPGNSQPVPDWSVRISPSAIDVMQRCLKYRKENRLTIPELLVHDFLQPKIEAPALPPGTTTITPSQMSLLVKFIIHSNNLDPLPEGDTSAADLFEQLVLQNTSSPP